MCREQVYNSVVLFFFFSLNLEEEFDGQTNKELELEVAPTSIMRRC